MQKYFVLIPALPLILLTFGCEPHEHDHGPPDPGAHVHGAAQLDLVLEVDGQARVYVEFHSPAVNLYGFEHAARSDEERSARDAALKTLKTPAEWLSFTGAECGLKDVTLEHSDEAHEHGDHADHGHDDGHSEVRASYVFDCEGAVGGARVSLHKAFPGIETIYVRALAESGEKSLVLRKDGEVVGFGI